MTWTRHWHWLFQANEQAKECVKATAEHLEIRTKELRFYFIFLFKCLQPPFINRQPGDFYRLSGFLNEKHNFEWQPEPRQWFSSNTFVFIATLPVGVMWCPPPPPDVDRFVIYCLETRAKWKRLRPHVYLSIVKDFRGAAASGFLLIFNWVYWIGTNLLGVAL